MLFAYDLSLSMMCLREEVNINVPNLNLEKI